MKNGAQSACFADESVNFQTLGLNQIYEI